MFIQWNLENLLQTKRNLIFLKNVEEKRKGQKARLQTDQEFQQKEIFELNKKYNVDMFSTAVRGKGIKKEFLGWRL